MLAVASKSLMDLCLRVIRTSLQFNSSINTLYYSGFAGFS